MRRATQPPKFTHQPRGPMNRSRPLPATHWILFPTIILLAQHLLCAHYLWIHLHSPPCTCPPIRRPQVGFPAWGFALCPAQVFKHTVLPSLSIQFPFLTFHILPRMLRVLIGGSFPSDSKSHGNCGTVLSQRETERSIESWQGKWEGMKLG